MDAQVLEGGLQAGLEIQNRYYYLADAGYIKSRPSYSLLWGQV